MFSLTHLIQDIGHLSFLEEASKLGDFIIVGVHTDDVSNKTTGVGRIL